MIVVGSSVWIDFFHGVSTPEVERQLDGLLGVTSLAIGDLILGEAMQGFRNERVAATARQLFRSLALLPQPGSRQWPLVFKKTAMASGITVTSNPDPVQLESLGVMSWPTWGCEVNTFPGPTTNRETCLLLQGMSRSPRVAGSRCALAPG